MKPDKWIVILFLGVMFGSFVTCTPQPADLKVEVDPAVLTAPGPMDSAAPGNTPRYDLHEASAQQLIKYEVHGAGMSSGASLLVAVQRLVDKDIDIYVVPGTIFFSFNERVQRMVAWGVMGEIVGTNEQMQPGSSMYLTNSEPRLYVIEAYCLNFGLENPSTNDVFQPATASRGGVYVRGAQIIHEGKRLGLSVAGIQTAIWADHEHKTKQEIQTKFDAADQEMDAAFEMLKNLPPPRVQ